MQALFYARPYLIPTKSALDPTQLGFANTLKYWKSMPVIGERNASTFASAAGGQGLLCCSCKGSCLVGRYACRQAGRVCNSRGHIRSCLNTRLTNFISVHQGFSFGFISDILF